MAYIDLKIKGKGLKEFHDYVQRMRGGDLSRIQRLAAYRFAQHAAREVRAGYREANFPVSTRTIERYEDPPHGSPAYTKASSMQRSGTMARSVVVRKLDGDAGYRVMIDPGRIYPGGKPVALIAEYLEAGYRFVMKVTAARLRYLHALRQTAGEPRKNNLKLGASVIVNKPARPIWEPAFRKLKRARGAYFQIVNKLLLARSKVGKAP